MQNLISLRSILSRLSSFYDGFSYNFAIFSQFAILYVMKNLYK